MELPWDIKSGSCYFGSSFYHKDNGDGKSYFGIISSSLFLKGPDTAYQPMGTGNGMPQAKQLVRW